MEQPPLNPVEQGSIEMSRVIDIDKVKASSHTEKAFTASDDECKALAQRFNIIAVNNFTGTVAIKYDKSSKSYLLSGVLQSSVTQECRATFQPVEQNISEDFTEVLVTEKEDLPSSEEALKSETVIELFEGDTIDYGEIATQWLALSLDPFPRAEGEVFQHIEYDGSETNPFSALKTIKLQDNDKK